MSHFESIAGDPNAQLTYTPERGVLWAAGEGQIVNMTTYLVCAVTFWLLLPAAWALAQFMRTACHRYELTDQRLRETRGVFFQRTDELELYRVADIVVEQPLLQRFVQRGRVVLRTADRSTPVVVLNAVPMPKQVANLIRDHVERCRVAKGVRHFDN